MRIIKKFLFAGFSLIFSLIIITGCAKGNKAEENTIYINKNGNVTGAIVESFDKDIYKEDELKTQIEKEIEVYEEDNKDASIKLQKFDVSDGKAKVNIEYDSIESYSGFNNVVAYCGTIKAAQAAGYEFLGEFKSTGKKPPITIEEIDKSEDYKVIILSERQKIVTDFKVLYTSTNVEVSDDLKTVTVSDSDDNTQYIYIIYKK